MEIFWRGLTSNGSLSQTAPTSADSGPVVVAAFVAGTADFTAGCASNVMSWSTIVRSGLTIIKKIVSPKTAARPSSHRLPQP